MIQTEKIIEAEKILQVSLSALQAIVQDVMDTGKLIGFTDYLDAIGCPRERLYHFVNEYEKLYKDEIEQIFVTNYIKDNEPFFEDLWFFCGKYCLKMSNFLSEDQTSWLRLKNSVISYTNKKRDYSEKDPNVIAKSSCFLSVTLSSRQTLCLRALGRNCNVLENIFNKYVLINQVTG